MTPLKPVAEAAVNYSDETSRAKFKPGQDYAVSAFLAGAEHMKKQVLGLLRDNEKAGFSIGSYDLMAKLPNQALADWLEEKLK